MQLDAVMVRDVPSVLEDAGLDDVRACFDRFGVEVAFVTDEAGGFMGTIVARDLRGNRARAARDVMRAPKRSVGPDDHVLMAAEIMAAAGVDHLPVFDGDRAVGVVSRGAVRRSVGLSQERLCQTIGGHLWRCGFHPPDHHIEISVSGDRIRLEGEVPDEADISVIGTLVLALESVAGVDNRLRAQHRRRG